MSGAPRVRSMNVQESEVRPVLGPAGNKARSLVAARKPASKPLSKVDRDDVTYAAAKSPSPSIESPARSPSLSAPSILRRQELLLHSNLSLNASCSSDCSTESFRSRASTGRIGRTNVTNRRRYAVPKPEKIVSKLERVVPDGISPSFPENFRGKRRCPWVTASSDASYISFHDEEWGFPVHDDKKLFELLVLSGALAELTWPTILSKRHIFRESFMDFDPVAVSKLNEKKITSPGCTASSLLSEPKLRAIIENARQIVKIIEEFGSFDKYCWSFVNYKPLISKFRYPRQVPVKSPKADVISKDLVRRGFRCVGPTVIYSFMQVAGITNDHLISCYRFVECCAADQGCVPEKEADPKAENMPGVDPTNISIPDEEASLGLDLTGAVDGLSLS